MSGNADAATDAFGRDFVPFDVAAELLDALAHPTESETVRPAPGVATVTIVGHFELEAIAVELQ